MENKEFIIESILSIEDFNDVDPEFMSVINSNAEYRRIFDEYKEISDLASKCVPAPKKNGVSLHDAVMTRVKNGDTAPRYLNTSSSGRKFMFPVATAASFVIVLAVAIIASNTIRMNNNNASGSSQEFVAYDDSLSQIQTIPNGTLMPAHGGTANDKKSAAPYCAPEEARMEAETEDYDYAAFDDEIQCEVTAASENAAVLKKHSYAKDVSTDSISIEITDDDIASRLAIAESRGVSDEDRITEEDVEAYGRENFVAWFDSIADAENFTELYGKKQFIRYCSDIWAKE